MQSRHTKALQSANQETQRINTRNKKQNKNDGKSDTKTREQARGNKTDELTETAGTDTLAYTRAH